MTPSHPSSGTDGAELRVGAIGCGGRLPYQAKGIAAADGVRLVAVYDIDEERVRAAATEHGATPYTDLDAMLREERLDVVTVVTPGWVRSEVILPVLATDVPAILVEKPLSLLPSEAHKLVAASEGRLVAINTQYQWMPHWRALWPRIAAGELGEIKTIRCSTWANIIEQGTHTMDLAMTIARHAGLPAATKVRASGFNTDRYARGERVPWNLEATYDLGDASLVCVHGDLNGPLVPGEEEWSFHILVEAIGTTGRLWVSLTKGWHLQTEGGGWEHGPTDWWTNDVEAQAALCEQLREHLASGADPAAFPTIIGRSATYQDMLSAAIASCLTGEEVDLSQPLDEGILSDDALLTALGPERPW